MSAAFRTNLLTLIDEAFDRRSWHGPNLRGSLRGVPSEQAAWRPGPRRHNIWELTVHTAYWKYVVRRRLSGAKRAGFPHPGSNWFARPIDSSERAWRADVALLLEQHRALRATVAALSDAILARPKVLHMLRGIALHDVHHGGQIQLLKRFYDERSGTR